MHDLVQAGIVGLVNAARSYDDNSGVAFSTYATHRVRGEMLDSLRVLDGASRQLRRFERRMKAVRSELSVALQRDPSEQEVLDRLTPEDAAARAKVSALAALRSTYAGSVEAVDVPVCAEQHPDSICARAERRRFLGRALRRLDARNRRLILLYYAANLTMKEIASRLDVNESRISQMHKSALKAMAKVLEASGIRSFQDFETRS